jgi:hypothetical protein
LFRDADKQKSKIDQEDWIFDYTFLQRLQLLVWDFSPWSLLGKALVITCGCVWNSYTKLLIMHWISQACNQETNCLNSYYCSSVLPLTSHEIVNKLFDILCIRFSWLLSEISLV